MKLFLDKTVIIILASVVLLNCLCIFVFIPQVSKDLKPLYNQESFQDGYDLLAANLADGHGYRFYPDTAKTVMREPGYPVLLGGLRLIFGPSFEQVKVVNVFFALITALLLAWLGFRVLGSGKLTLLAPALFLVHPGTVIAESRGGVEILFGALLALFMVALYKAIETDDWRAYLLAGSVLGLTLLVRSTPIAFAGFLLPYLLVVGWRRTRAARICQHVGILVLAMSAILSPWIIRNYVLTGRFIPTASVLGVSAQAGQYICAHLTGSTRWVDLDRAAGRERKRLAEEAGFRVEGIYYQVFYNTADEVAFSNYLFKRVVERYKDNPALCLKCAAYNVLNLWCAGKTWSSTTMNAGIQIPYLGFALAGVIFRLRQKRLREVGPIVLLIGYMVCVYAPVLAQARYSVPLMPFVSVLAVIGLSETWRVWKRLPVSEEPEGVETNGVAEVDSTVIRDEGRRGASDLRNTPGFVSSRLVESLRSELAEWRSPAVSLATLEEPVLSIVIPAYNEEARLPNTVLATLRWCTAQNLAFEIIIADDGSQDSTLALAGVFAQFDPCVRVVACTHSGKGGAVRTGMLKARGRAVLFMDADGATPLTEIPKLLKLTQSHDIVIGSRVVSRPGEVEVKTSLRRRIIGRVFARIVNIFAVWGVEDTQCGFKMFRREAALRVFEQQKITGFAFDVEILWIARRLAFSITEVPVNWVAQPGSKVNLVGDSIRMLKDIARIRWMHRDLGGMAFRAGNKHRAVSASE